MLKKKLKYSLIIALFRSMHTFQMRFTIIPLAIIRPEHLRTISGPWELYTRVPPNNFSMCTQGGNVPSQVLILRLSEPRPTLGKQLAQGR